MFDAKSEELIAHLRPSKVAVHAHRAERNLRGRHKLEPLPSNGLPLEKNRRVIRSDYERKKTGPVK